MLINELHLNVDVAGSGPVIMALHGFTGDMRMWESFILATRGEYMVVRVDMLGHGMSEVPVDPARYRMERCIEDLAAILDRLDVGQVHWLGYSMGGRVALSAALALPDRTSAVIIEGGSPGLALYEERESRARSDESLASWIEKVGIDEFVAYWETLPLFTSQARLSLETRESLRRMRLCNKSLGLANTLRGLGVGVQPPLHQRLTALAVPTLFITGDEDINFVTIAQEMRNLVDNSQIRHISAAGHAPHLEQPEEFNKAVLDFLAMYRKEPE